MTRSFVVRGAVTLCVDIGATNIRVGLARGGQVLRVNERRLADLLLDYPGDVVSAIGEMISAVRAASPDVDQGPIGIGVPAIVREDGSLRVALSSGIPGGSVLRDRLTERLASEVVVDNDASLAALGEALYGAGQGEHHVALLTLGTNIGMGVVIDGRVYRGARGAAGEIGTVPLRLGPTEADRWQLVRARRQQVPQSAWPTDGYVWLEELYGGQALLDLWKKRSAAGNRDQVRTTERVLALAAAGDRVAADLVHEAVDGWAAAIATVGNVLDPGIVLIAGGIAADLGPHLESIRQAVGALMPGRAPRVEIAALGPLAGLIGAGAAARALAT